MTFSLKADLEKYIEFINKNLILCVGSNRLNLFEKVVLTFAFVLVVQWMNAIRTTSIIKDTAKTL